MKKCIRCKKIKNLNDFYTGKGLTDGHLNVCKICVIKRVAIYSKTKAGRETEKRRNQKRREYSREQDKKHALRHPDRYKARYLLKNAVRDGRIIKKSCEICNDPKTQAHHTDYSKPLDVEWLCFKHHRQKHGQFVY